VIGRRIAAIAAVTGVVLVGSGQVIGAQSDQSGKEALEATEIGITDSTIRIAVVADVEKALAPGLFAGSPAAVQGFAKYINKNGGLAGRTGAVRRRRARLSAPCVRLLTGRTASTLGTASPIRPASSTSASVGAPKDVPLAAARAAASTISGRAWPNSSAPQDCTRSTYRFPSTSKR